MKQLIDYLVRECTSVTPVQVDGHLFDRAEVDDLRTAFIEDIRWDLATAKDQLAELELTHREGVDNGEPVEDLLADIQDAVEEIRRLEAELSEAEAFTL